MLASDLSILTASNMEGESKYGQMAPYYENLFRPLPRTEHDEFLDRFWFWGFPGFSFGVAMCVGNWFMRKPVLSGIQKHIFAMAVGVAFGEGFRRFTGYLSSERDASVRHYIMLHPEDFPEPGKTRWAD
ncbi:hypothetical protein HPB48_005388 [Haemaphysalis longicornis]|uniref:NADH dehydrogenase [ubiquinone] 1 subunit C2 n=1 Tax=Haemaphysalis longicornis TaxID=44386 RepID=A0A9J6GGY6_HAELO|nr:hypothetical protein HPB48_005388 [Haemaphysalis longicornis]